MTQNFPPPQDPDNAGCRPGPCPLCPLAPRLERAKQVYRTQQATIAQLADALERHRRIGLRLWQQPASQALYGSLVWSENVCLRREVARHLETIRQQCTTIQALKRLAQQKDVA